jgi:hypothetical protein
VKCGKYLLSVIGRSEGTLRVICSRLSVNRTVEQACRLPIHGMASGSACPTNPLLEVRSRKSFTHATHGRSRKSEVRDQKSHLRARLRRGRQRLKIGVVFDPQAHGARSTELRASSSWSRQRRSLPYSFKTGTERGASRQSLWAKQTLPGYDRSGDRPEGHPIWDSISNRHG